MVERTPRLVGEARQAMAAELAGPYHDGASIRSLARESGRSYGLVQKLLREAGVEFRPRGGADPASPETKAGRETVETSQEADHNDSSNTDEVDGSSGNPEPSGTGVDALKLAVEAAVARAEKADRKARKAEKALHKLRRTGAGKSRRKKAKATLNKRRAKAEKLIVRCARRVVGLTRLSTAPITPSFEGNSFPPKDRSARRQNRHFHS